MFIVRNSKGIELLIVLNYYFSLLLVNKLSTIILIKHRTMNFISIRAICYCFLIAILLVNSFHPTRNYKKSQIILLHGSSNSKNNAMDNKISKTFNLFFKSSLLAFFAATQIVTARPEGVNRPDLLPKEVNVPLIDVANFLSKGQEKKIIVSINDLQKTTGYKLRLLCQR